MLLSCCHLAYLYYQTHYLQKMLKDLMRYRFVEVDGGTTGGVKTGHPHRADKDDSQGVAGVFKFYVQSRFL